MSENPNTNPIDRAKFDVHPDVDSRFTKRVLTPRLRRLVDAYVRTGSYAEAARASGYSAQTAKKYITEDESVRKAIGEIVDQAAILSGVTLERVLQEYARLAFVDMGELVDLLKVGDDPDEAIMVLSDLPADITAAISEITLNRSTKTDDEGREQVTGQLKVKLYDKKGALQDLGRMLSVFNDKLTIEDKSGFGDRLERAIQKIEGITNGDFDSA